MVGPEMTRRRIVFLTGTRADFGKLKPLIEVAAAHPRVDVTVFDLVRGDAENATHLGKRRAYALLIDDQGLPITEIS